MTDLTGQQIAAIMGVTASRVSQLRRSDALPLGPREFGEWLRARQADAAEEIDGRFERARLDKERADKIELENQATRRGLIPVAEVEQTIGLAFAEVANSLKSLPDLLERKIGIGPDTAEAVEHAIFQAMDSLADRLSALGLESPSE